jgi:acyl carrier protein
MSTEVKPGVETKVMAREVREFIVSSFLYGENRTFSDEDSFLTEGIIDSTGVLQLVAFLEESYGIRVADEELTPDKLDSIHSVCAYVRSKLEAGPGSHGGRA